MERMKPKAATWMGLVGLGVASQATFLALSMQSASAVDVAFGRATETAQSNQPVERVRDFMQTAYDENQDRRLQIVGWAAAVLATGGAAYQLGKHYPAE